jgi:hypothetical protein
MQTTSLTGCEASSIRANAKLYQTFRTIVGIGLENKKISESPLQELRTPRELHDFVGKLIVLMNNDSMSSTNPFIATPDNVKTATKQTISSMRGRKFTHRA